MFPRRLPSVSRSDLGTVGEMSRTTMELPKRGAKLTLGAPWQIFTPVYTLKKNAFKSRGCMCSENRLRVRSRDLSLRQAQTLEISPALRAGALLSADPGPIRAKTPSDSEGAPPPSNASP